MCQAYRSVCGQMFTYCCEGLQVRDDTGPGLRLGVTGLVQAGLVGPGQAELTMTVNISLLLSAQKSNYFWRRLFYPRKSLVALQSEEAEHQPRPTGQHGPPGHAGPPLILLTLYQTALCTQETQDNIDPSRLVGSLPNCTTAMLLAALDGQFSVKQQTFAPASTTMQTGLTVEQWKQRILASGRWRKWLVCNIYNTTTRMSEIKPCRSELQAAAGRRGRGRGGTSQSVQWIRLRRGLAVRKGRIDKNPLYHILLELYLCGPQYPDVAGCCHGDGEPAGALCSPAPGRDAAPESPLQQVRRFPPPDVSRLTSIHNAIQIGGRLRGNHQDSRFSRRLRTGQLRQPFFPPVRHRHHTSAALCLKRNTKPEESWRADLRLSGYCQKNIFLSTVFKKLVVLCCD